MLFATSLRFRKNITCTVYIVYYISSQLYLTCAGETITGVSLIAFTEVAPGTTSRADVRCNRSTGGEWMTCTGCIRCTGVQCHIYTQQDTNNNLEVTNNNIKQYVIN